MTAMRSTVFALALLVLAFVGAAQTPVTFLQPESFGSCTSLAAADFNGDGNLDLACAGTTITVWLGDGHGHFHQTPQTLAAANPWIVAGDFNGDGIPDLVVASTIVGGRNQLVLLPGRGDGAFGAPITIVDLPSSNFTALAAADLTRNGRLDLVVAVLPAGDDSGTVEALLGNGDGTFQTPVTTGASAANFTNIAVADFNGDGIPDVISVAIIQFTYTLQVTLGNGEGTFGPPIDTPIPSVPPTFAVADFTGNGLPGVALSGFGANDIYVLEGNGDGAFSPGPVTAGAASAILLAADLNGDGQPDLVMSGMGVALNQGGGVFAPAVWYQNQLGGGGLAGDFRHLGRPDLVVAGDFYVNDGAGAFLAPRSFPTACADCFLIPGDFHNDGNLDAAAVSGNVLRVYSGNGRGDFTAFSESTFPLPSKESFLSAAAADFNGDGNLDLVLGVGGFFGVQYQGEALVLLGNGDGTFGPPSILYTGYQVEDLVTADFNRSGHTGIAIGTLYGIVVMCGNGAGGFHTTAAIQGISNSTSLVTADFNHDGIPDLATASDVYLGNGDGTFRHSYTLPQAGVLVQTGDFNGDGIPDLVTSDYFTGVVMRPGLGDGTFGPPVTVADGFAPNLALMAVADLNADGISDIAVTIDLAATATLYLGSRAGSFTAQTINNLPQLNGFPVSVGDFNNDGRIDLLFVAGNGLLMTLINNTR